MWKDNKYTEFYNSIRDLIESPNVRAMSEISHHVNVNCLDHSIFVSYISFLLCRFFRLDYVAGARGALLHDLYLYDWRKELLPLGNHLLSHPAAALKNASSLYDLSDKEKDIILSHMWPLTKKAPKYKESFLVGCADKFCAIAEVLYIYKYMKINTKLEIAGEF